MAVTGWAGSMWHKDHPPTAYSDSLLANLAGNVFSAFAAGPVIMLAIAIAGATPPCSRRPALRSRSHQR
eukprot:9653702-Alexandrium_andersonii.AAC.1